MLVSLNVSSEQKANWLKLQNTQKLGSGSSQLPRALALLSFGSAGPTAFWGDSESTSSVPPKVSSLIMLNEEGSIVNSDLLASKSLDKGMTFITPKVLTPISPNGVLPSATFKLVSYCFQSKLFLLMTKSFHDVSSVNDYGQSVHGVTMVLILTALLDGHCSFRSTCSIHGCTRENFVAREVGWN
jgi:hypothetical protein